MKRKIGILIMLAVFIPLNMVAADEVSPLRVVPLEEIFGQGDDPLFEDSRFTSVGTISEQESYSDGREFDAILRCQRLRFSLDEEIVLRGSFGDIPVISEALGDVGIKIVRNRETNINNANARRSSFEITYFEGPNRRTRIITPETDRGFLLRECRGVSGFEYTGNRSSSCVPGWDCIREATDIGLRQRRDGAQVVFSLER